MLAIAAVSVSSKTRHVGSIPDFGQRGLGERGHLGIADRLAREVDVQHEPSPRPLVLGDQGDRLACDPAIDGLNQSGALGDIEEGAGQERLAAPVAEFRTLRL